jgi:hypothetical protein
VLAKVVGGMTMSVDGFVTDANGRGSGLENELGFRQTAS